MSEAWDYLIARRGRMATVSLLHSQMCEAAARHKYVGEAGRTPPEELGTW
jgi:hypothetical protein